jgi:hypothetical protein
MLNRRKNSEPLSRKAGGTPDELPNRKAGGTPDELPNRKAGGTPDELPNRKAGGTPDEPPTRGVRGGGSGEDRQVLPQPPRGNRRVTVQEEGICERARSERGEAYWKYVSHVREDVSRKSPRLDRYPSMVTLVILSPG